MKYRTALSLPVLVLTLSALTFADDEAEIRDLVFEAQRAGFERHALEEYMAQWAEDARVVIGRVEEAGKHDLVLKRDQLEATRRLRFRGDPAPGIKLSYDEITIEVNETRAELRVRSTARFDEGFEQMREVYRLRKTPKGWRVYENRAWPIQTKYRSQTIVFDADAWEALDAEVERLERSGDPRQLAGALFSSYRFREAYEAAKRLTELEGAKAASWVLRGQMAVFAGDAADSEASFKKALEIDPAADVPAFAEGLSDDSD